MAPELTQLALVPAAPTPPSQRTGRIAVSVGPGWFDSSRDLRRGLEVAEGWPADMRLHGWTRDYLQAQRAPGRTASPSASTAMA